MNDDRSTGNPRSIRADNRIFSTPYQAETPAAGSTISEVVHDPAIETAPSHAQHEQTEQQALYRIGAGCCGEVFQLPDNAIAKRAKTQLYAVQLKNDYVTYKEVLAALAKRAELNIDIRVPDVGRFVGEDDSAWWDAHNFPERSADNPRAVMIAERIPPLDKGIRTRLIRKYCGEAKQAEALANKGNKDCLVRVYLGLERPVERKSVLHAFTLRNFKIYVDEMEQLGLDASAYAKSMGQTLALMH